MDIDIKYLCCLHPSNKCNARQYNSGYCDLEKSSEYAKCQYRQLTVGLTPPLLEKEAPGESTKPTHGKTSFIDAMKALIHNQERIKNESTKNTL